MKGLNYCMDNIKKQQIIAEARIYWDAEHPIKAGMLIFERVPLDFRAEWATSILEFVYAHIEPVPEIDAVLEFAKNPNQWPMAKAGQAHDLFTAVRKRSLERTPTTEIDNLISRLAENTTAVTYNSRQYPAPFDHQKAWRIADLFKELVARLQLGDDIAWRVLSNQYYILLDTPISCNSACPMCHPPKWDYLPGIRL
jgi:hypothetical protein